MYLWKFNIAIKFVVNCSHKTIILLINTNMKWIFNSYSICHCNNLYTWNFNELLFKGRDSWKSAYWSLEFKRFTQFAVSPELVWQLLWRLCATGVGADFCKGFNLKSILVMLRTLVERFLNFIKCNYYFNRSSFILKYKNNIMYSLNESMNEPPIFYAFMLLLWVEN